MDFGFNQEQRMLRDAVRRTLARELPVDKVRQVWSNEAKIVPALWQVAAEGGWQSLLVPEEHGGMGLGVVDMVVVHEELGRALFPGPFTATSVIAVSLIRALTSQEQQERWLPEISGGEMMLSLAWLEEDADWQAPTQTMRVQLEPVVRLSGTKHLVEFPQVVTHFLLMTHTRREDKTVQLIGALLPAAASGLHVQSQESLDLSQTIGTLALDDVEVPTANVFTAELSQKGLNRLLAPAVIATCADMIGLSEAALYASIEYAKVRKQFDRPIGSFQAIKHKLTNAFVLLENARSAVYYAAWTLDAGQPDADLAVEVAKAYCSEMAFKVTAEAIQVHGGIGFTWENDCHLYFKRTRRLMSFYGDALQAVDHIGEEIAAGLLDTLDW